MSPFRYQLHSRMGPPLARSELRRGGTGRWPRWFRMAVWQPSVNAGLRPPPSAADGVDRGLPASRWHLIDQWPGAASHGRQILCQIIGHRRIYADSRRHRQSRGNHGPSRQACDGCRCRSVRCLVPSSGTTIRPPGSPPGVAPWATAAVVARFLPKAEHAHGWDVICHRLGSRKFFTIGRSLRRPVWAAEESQHDRRRRLGQGADFCGLAAMHGGGLPNVSPQVCCENRERT